MDLKFEDGLLLDKLNRQFAVCFGWVKNVVKHLVWVFLTNGQSGWKWFWFYFSCLRSHGTM